MPVTNAYESEGESSIDSEYGGESDFTFSKYYHLTWAILSNLGLKLGEQFMSEIAKRGFNNVAARRAWYFLRLLLMLWMQLI